MGLFRRQVKGKHSLGAAVTSIPAGPMFVPVAAAEPVLPEPSPISAEAYLPSVQPDVLSSMVEMFATGEVWASDTPAAPAPAAAPVPAPISAVPARLPVEVHAPEPVEAPRLSARATLQAALGDLLPHGDEPVPTGPPLEAVAPAPALLEPVVPVILAEPAVEPTPLLQVPVPPPVAALHMPVTVAPIPTPPVPMSTPAACAAATPLQAAPLPARPPQPRTPATSRVQLGFRDGTSASLDPSSSQFLALEQLAQTLTRRD